MLLGRVSRKQGSKQQQRLWVAIVKRTCSRNRLFSLFEVGTSDTSLLHTSSFRAISALVTWSCPRPKCSSSLSAPPSGQRVDQSSCEVRSSCQNRLFGLVVKASASRAEDPGLESRLRRNFFGVESYHRLKNGTPVATLPGAWCYMVSDGTGWPGVSIL